jgi:shikimate dehydrogenase
MTARKRAAGDIARIGGGTRIAAVCGDPVDHSMSPAMHNAAYAALGLDRAYVAFNVKPKDLAPALRAIPALGIVGVNLTVPHKEQAAKLIKRLSAEARMLAAVNCIVNRGGVLLGDNTDARGLARDLRSLGVAIRGGVAVVIGAGGAAASAILACARLGAAQIVIANRTRARGERLARRLSRVERSTRIVARGLDALVDRELLGAARIIINATPMGLTTPRFARLDYKATSADCFFYDLLYSARPTAFLKPAIALKRRIADGAGMLINQGELAFELFNGIAPPRGVMRSALFAHLGRRPK